MHRFPGCAEARRRWRRVSEAPAGVAPAPGALELRQPWSLDEVGAAAVELGLFPEGCLRDGQTAAERP